MADDSVLIYMYLWFGAHAPKAYGSRFMYLCICNLDFSKVAKNQALANAEQAQRDNISNLDFWIKVVLELKVIS